VHPGYFNDAGGRCRITKVQPPKQASYLVTFRCTGASITTVSYWMTVQLFLSAPGEPTSIQ
jgi:hypothetical protein